MKAFRKSLALNEDLLWNDFKYSTGLIKSYYDVGELEARERRFQRIRFRVVDIIKKSLFTEVYARDSARAISFVIEFELIFVVLASLEIGKCQISPFYTT
jgi:hypothetical protein